MGEITEFAQKVKQLEREERHYQEALTDPPDEFLDPIMSTLMTGKSTHHRQFPWKTGFQLNETHFLQLEQFSIEKSWIIALNFIVTFCHLLTDPVILPSSHVTVDRTTISRHLLSDQTDPFNRAPLTMDLVKPDIELKAKIQAWIVERKKERSEAAATVSQ